ncbi:hypothetical protein BD324DRAFT_637472 [Kockovaella imperatae]|uniref:Isopropylmalate dehydrogenase-like domain-containing protein n=1 Tax=Kockovaella imperatae TaxID=4999 RepID=A0A1Y1U9W7_9TREE|nr:hypothetical protein BD324DRAFT_637472 [Kockovaella imperatae]ORX34307.1 hypothetical protein BD324DRAFT_637472 [Kockovaella imperatae]
MAIARSVHINNMTRTHRIAVIPGDGIGIETVAATLRVLEKLSALENFSLDLTHFDYGSARYKSTGSYTPETFPDELRPYDSILFGAVGDPDVPDHISLWKLLLPMRQIFQQYVNCRPVCLLPGVKACVNTAATPSDLDWVIVRENSEGEYSGQGGRSHIGTVGETATEVGIFTRFGCERLIRWAFELASGRPRKLLTLVTKSNAQRSGLVLWDECANRVAKDYPDVKWDKMLVDAMTVRMVRNPASLDVIVCTNLHGDILSDLAAALAGSIGIAPSANLVPDHSAPALFEPVHGSAFDIMGKGIANPIGTIWSAAMMLDYLGEKAAAARLERAFKKALADGATTADLGGELDTEGAAQAVIDRL